MHVGIQPAAFCIATDYVVTLCTIVANLAEWVQEVLQHFRRGKLQALVAVEAATDNRLLPRSLQHMVYYDAPSSAKEYITSVARTGPLASDGHALTFLSRSHAPIAQPLLQLMQVSTLLPLSACQSLMCAACLLCIHAACDCRLLSHAQMMLVSSCGTAALGVAFNVCSVWGADMLGAGA